MDLIKLAMLKMHADCNEAGLPATPEEIVAECMMASNVILSYGGCSPATAVLGVNPRDLSEFESDGGAQTSRSDSGSAPEDYLERCVRLRLSLIHI